MVNKGKKKSLPYIRYLLSFTKLSFAIGIIQGLYSIYIHSVIGLGIALVFVALLAYAFIVEHNLKKRFELEVTTHANELNRVKKDMFLEAPLPVVILDKLGNITWYNGGFQTITDKEDLLDTNIRSIILDLQVENLPKANEQYERLVSLGDQTYKMVCNRTMEDEDSINFSYAIYLIDVSRETYLEEQVINERSMIGYLYLDNYEEIIETIEEVRRPAFRAIVDRKIAIWFKSHDAILSKFDRDRYMLFFTESSLNAMQARKFDILDEIRQTQAGNDLPVTISIGIGRNFEDLNHSKEDARAALDLALGRGGDQAIIKYNDKYTFYGGKTKEVEKSTRVKVRIKAYAFKELLQASDKIYIMGHRNIDVDCLGAAMGVYRAARMMGKEAQIILNEPNFSVQGIYDRIVATPEYSDIFLTPEKAEQEMTKQALLVLVDVHRKSYVEAPELLDRTENIVIFDHHRLSTDFIEDAVLTYIEPFISSTCEMITEILNYLTDKVKLTQVEADALLAGITVDTKNFVFKTGVRTFEAAAVLKRAGADTTRVRMLFQNDLDTYRIRAAAIKDLEIWKDNMAITVVRVGESNNNILAAQVADELLTIKEIQSAFVITPNEEEVTISARAIADVNVQRVMELLGGGGHKNIAGAQLKGVTEEEAIQKIKEAINQYEEEGD